MNLIVFAHKKEANAFVQKSDVKKYAFHLDGLYTNAKIFVLITGQGLHLSAVKTTAFLTLHANKVNKIINMGTAGRLEPNIEMNKVYAVHKSFLFENLTGKKFISESQNAKLNCLTVNQHLSSKPAILAEMNIGLVDMELWSIASVAALFGKPFDSYKIVSDDGFNIQKEQIIENADFYSQALFDFYNKHEN